MTPGRQSHAEMTEVQAYCALMEARAVVIECCIKLGLEHLHANISVEWEPRLTTTMGNARSTISKNTGEIKLSPALWARASAEERRATTIHEAAHVLAALIHRRCCGHGPLWVSVMNRLGARATRCHSVSTEGLRRKSLAFLVRCQGCSRSNRFTPQKRAQLMTGRRVFTCGMCQRGFTASDGAQAEAV